jgi:hypothetical protein
MYKTRSSYQDRLGTNIGKVEKREGCGFFSQGFGSSVTIKEELEYTYKNVAAFNAALEALDQVRKTPLFAPFIYKSGDFTKTGSGQT